MEKIWFKDITNLINENNYDKFFPSSYMSYTEKLNSFVRLSIYFSILVIVIKKEPNILFVPIITSIFTYFLYHNEYKKQKAEAEFFDRMNLYRDENTNEICYRPTPNNPFMNILMNDYKENPNRKKACNVSQGPIRKKAQQYFNRNLYRDVSDVFHKNASDRNFITMPVTTIPNDDGAFKNFLYDIKKTCKEGNGNVCYSNRSRHILK